MGEGERGRGVGDSPAGVTKGGGGFRTMVGLQTTGVGAFVRGGGG